MSDYNFRPLASLDDVEPLRAARVETLAAPPELFIEQFVGRSAVYAIECDGVIGYLTDLDGTLTELFVVPEHRTHVDAVLKLATESLGLKYAWASTLDPIALAACTCVSSEFSVVGFQFRTLHAVTLPTPDPLPVERIADLSDVDRVRAANHPEVFDEPTDIPIWLENGWVTLFELSDDVAGFGLCTPAGPHTRGADIGIRVCDSHQRRGLGAWIVQRMASLAQSKGLIPTAGCGLENTVSRRTLERAGFVADHRLLRFNL